MKIRILIDTIDKVKRFVSKVAGFEGDLDLSTGRYVIDAKSIMGIFSLDISQPLTLTIYDESLAPDLMEQLKEFTLPTGPDASEGEK